MKHSLLLALSFATCLSATLSVAEADHDAYSLSSIRTAHSSANLLRSSQGTGQLNVYEANASDADFLIVLDISPAGTVRKGTMYRKASAVTNGVKGFVWMKQDVNQRIPSGKQVEYRAVNVNPYRFTVNGENSLTPATENLSAAAVKMLQGLSASTTAAAGTSKEAETPKKSGDTPKTLIDDRIGMMALPLMDHVQSLTNQWSYQSFTTTETVAATSQAEACLTRLKRLRQSAPFMDDIDKVDLDKVDDLIKESDRSIQSFVEEAISCLRMTKSTKGRDQILEVTDKTINEFSNYASKLLLLQSVKRNDSRQAEVVARNASRTDREARNSVAKGHVKTLTGAIDSARALLALPDSLRIIARSENTTLPANFKPGNLRIGQSQDTQIILANMRHSALEAVKRATGRDSTDVAGALTGFLGTAKSEATVLKDALATDAITYQACLSETQSKLDQIPKDLEGLRNKRIREEGKCEQLETDLRANMRFNTFAAFVGTDLELAQCKLRITDIDLQIQDMTTRQTELQKFLAEVKAWISSDADVLTQVDGLVTELKTDESKLTDAANNAGTFYGGLLSQNFETTTSKATQTKEGTVDYTVAILPIGDDGKTGTASGEPYKFTYEVFSPNHRKIVDVSGTYVFSSLQEKTFFRDASAPFAIHSDTKSQFTDELALLAHVPFDQSSSNSWAISFGTNVSVKRYYLGLSYLFGRDRGMVFTAGYVAGQILDQSDNQPTGAAGAPVNTISRLHGGVFFGIGFRL